MPLRADMDRASSIGQRFTRRRAKICDNHYLSLTTAFIFANLKNRSQKESESLSNSSTTQEKCIKNNETAMKEFFEPLIIKISKPPHPTLDFLFPPFINTSTFPIHLKAPYTSHALALYSHIGQVRGYIAKCRAKT